MPQLSSKATLCLKAATNLGPEDTARFVELFDTYSAAGLSQAPAAQKAASDLVAEIRSEGEALLQSVGALTTKPVEHPAGKALRAKSHPAAVRGSIPLAEISRALGGLSPSLLPDLSQKVNRTRTSKLGSKTQYVVWDNPPVPGVGPLFRVGGTGDLGEVARVLEEAGYLTHGTTDADGVAAGNQAADIIRAELARGGSTLRVGDADAIEAEARRRADETMGEPEQDPWDSFSFTPDDLDESGYSGASDEVRAAVEQLLQQAESAGVDTETIREDVARALGADATDEAYHDALKQALQQAIDQRRIGPSDTGTAQAGGGDRGQAAEQAGGARGEGRQGGPDQEGLTLSAQTPDDLKAKAEREAAARRADEAEQQRLERKARADAQRDEFSLTGSDRAADVAAAAGQGDIFGGQAAEKELAGPTPNYKAGDRITPDKDVIEGDVVTYDGKRWMARVKRGVTVPLAPIVNGKPVVNADSVIRVNLNNNEVTHTGMNVYGYGGQPVFSEKPAAPAQADPLDAALAGARDAPAAPAWNTPIPAKGLAVQPGDDKPDSARNIVWRVAEDAVKAITPTQKLNGSPLYAYLLPSTETEHGVVRLLPDDQTAPAGWKLLFPDALRVGMMSPDQVAAKLREALGREPILASGPAPAPAAAGAKKNPAQATPKKPGEVDNFGQTLPTARRAMAAKLDEDLADSDIAARPLSEIWPLAENEAIEDTFAAAVAHAAREEIPAKPRQPYKVRNWVEKVKAMRSLAGHVVSGRLTRERLIDEVKGPRAGLRDWASKVFLLEQLPRDQWKRVGDVEERPDSVTYKNGTQVPMPTLRLSIDGKSHWLSGDAGITGSAKGTVDGNRAAIMALLATDAPEARMQFEIRGLGPYKINKKGDSQYRPLMSFDSLVDARKAVKEDYNSLVAAWEAIKDRDNITERDLRTAENRERAGQDWRKGADVTAEQFQDTFKFRGGEFGAWVAQGKGDKERQAMLNGAFDALMDLAQIVGVPPRAISLNGTLGIAFGSRGSGWASAHYEPSNLVINLTKTRGAGALAHEWFHALDNYFSRARRGGAEAPFTGNQTAYRDENFITHRPERMMVDKRGKWPPVSESRLQQLRKENPLSAAYNPANWMPDPKHPDGVRPEVERRFVDLVAALNASPMVKRARTLDGTKTGDGYWSRTLELAARAFESYVIARMQEDGYHNDFLVNVRKSEDVGKNPDRYPYLLPGEVKPIADAFGALFSEIKTRQDDAGNVAMFSLGASKQTETPEFKRWFGASKVVDADGDPRVVYHGTAADFTVFDPVRGSTPGAWFTADAESAKEFGDPKAVFLMVTNPASMRDLAAARRVAAKAHDPMESPAEFNRAVITELESKGFDGVHDASFSGAGGSGSGVFAVFRPEQIKSATGNTGTFDPSNPDIRFGIAARPASSAAAQAKARVQATTTKITDGWSNAPSVRVIGSMDEAPQEVRAAADERRDSGAAGSPEGFWHNGTVYLVAEQLPSDADVTRVLFHEALGHAGLRGVFGSSLNTVLDTFAQAMPVKVAAKAAEYGLDMRDLEQRRQAAEEALAEIAQTRPKLGSVQRLIAAIRTWLRENLPGLGIKMSDAEVLRNFIEPARGWVERGRAAAAGGPVRFMVAYHGTPHRFDKFTTDAMGTGEGAQAFGWGLYFTNSKDIAEWYRKKLTDTNEELLTYDGRRISKSRGVKEMAKHLLAQNDGDVAEARKSLDSVLDNPGMFYAKRVDEVRQTLAELLKLDPKKVGRKHAGQLYEVDIPESSEMLLWDKPLSEQPDAALLREIASEEDMPVNYRKKALHGAATGEDFYRALSSSLGSDQSASRVLESYGIKGIDYPAQSLSGGAKDGARNYVIFSGDDVSIRATMFSRSTAGRGRPGVDLDRAWRDLSGANKFADFDAEAATKVTRHEDGFVLSRELPGNRWASLNVREFTADDGVTYYTSSLETGLEGFPKGTGAATVMYLQALNIAQKQGMGWHSESVRSDNAQAIYANLQRAGIPFREVDGASVISAESLSRVNFADVLSRLEVGREPVMFSLGQSLADRVRNYGGGEKIVGETGRQYTTEQLAAMRHVGAAVQMPTLEERAKALWKDAGKKLAQGLVDQFAPVKELSGKAYSLLRLSKGASGAFETLLQGGKLKLSDGVYDFDESAKGGVVETLLKPLGGEHHDFFRWIAANRAERLMGEGKENLFTEQDIAALKTLADGTTSFSYTIRNGANAGQVTRDRTLIYADALRTFNGFNKNVLDMAEQSGLIDGESRAIWEHDFYVPFYRVSNDEDGGIAGANVKSGMVRQQAFKELKGGANALNNDLLDNTLMNWAHLIDASAKNRAAVEALAAAERMGVAMSAPEDTARQMASSVGKKSNVVWAMDQGRKHFYVVDDPYVMTALTALEFSGMKGPAMKVMSAFKHALTVGVTASPFFKIRNLIRDSVQVIGTSNIDVNPLHNLSSGWKLTDPKSDAYFRLLAGGGTIHFGTMMEGSEAKRVQALVESGVDSGTILNSDQKVKAFYRKVIEPAITAYNELGNRGESVNRAALYDQLIKQGKSHAEASLMARDLMDFSMQGSFTSVRFLSQIVPFFNARIQGMYKLGRAAKEDPARFSAVVGATTLASLGLLMAFGDDDDWKKREEWDRNNFWWFKIGGTAYRIPKPFEIGAVATLAERGFELAFDKEMTGKRFRQQVMTLLGDNLSMNPVPQLVKPMLDVYANVDSFSGRPIESMGMEKLKADYRFTGTTSMAARGISTAANAVTGLVDKETLSPLQVDHLLRGYFGWLGSFVIGAGDVLARPATGQADRPASDMWKAATGGMVSDLRDAPSRYVSQMYRQAQEIEEAHNTWKMLVKQGKVEEATDFAAENRPQLMKFQMIEHLKASTAKINQRIKAVEQGDASGDQKREQIRSLQEQRDRLARRLATI